MASQEPNALTAFVLRACEARRRESFTGSLLSFDPGITTGWAFFQNNQFIACGQQRDDDVTDGALHAGQLIAGYTPDVVVVEDYRVYKWRKDEHTWDALHTPRLIGCIELEARKAMVPLAKQPAHVAKQFCTDSNLRKWHVYEHTEGTRHARDAVRHGIYFLLFGDITKWPKPRLNPMPPPGR